MGEVCIVPEGLECCIGQRQVLLRPKKEIDGRYFFYALRSNYVRHQIFWNEGTGSTVSNVRIPFLEALKIPRLGPSEESIGSLLGALDDKIDILRRMNETLEAMARAIFKDWFVDFGPTRAKMEDRAPYFAPEIWSLFPDRVDNERKPQGWEVRPLSSIATLARDTITPASFPSELFDHYSIPAFDAGKTPIREVGEGILSNKTIVLSDAVLLSKLNPEIPRVWLVDSDSAVRSICSTELLVFSPRVPTDRALLYSLMTEAGFTQRLESMVTGTSKSHQRVSPQSVMALDIMTARRPTMDAFREVAAPLLDRMSASRRESRTLAATRDLLLPKLMSGEIRVRDAEKIAEAAQ
jgi:type I restriction enzyme S subunit